MKGHIPVFWWPSLDVVQPGSQQVSVDVLGLLQDHFRLYSYPIGPFGLTFFLPDGGGIFKIAGCGRGGGGETAGMGHEEEDTVTGSDPLDFTPVLGFQSLNSEATLLCDAVVIGIAYDHPEILGHHNL